MDEHNHAQTLEDGFAVRSSSKVSQQNSIDTHTFYNADRITKRNIDHCGFHIRAVTMGMSKKEMSF